MTRHNPVERLTPGKVKEVDMISVRISNRLHLLSWQTYDTILAVISQDLGNYTLKRTIFRAFVQSICYDFLRQSFWLQLHAIRKLDYCIQIICFDALW